MGESKSVTDWFNEQSTNPVFLESIIMWINNPSARSARYGADKFWQAVRNNLQNRYSVIEIRKTVQDIREFIEDRVEELGRERLNSQIETLLEDPNTIPLESNLIDMLKKDKHLRHHVYVFAEYFIEEELWEYDLDGGDKRSINSRLSKRVKGGKMYSFDDFVKLGLLYKLPWVKASSSASETTRYIIPSHSIIVLAELYADPDLEQPFTCRYCEMTFGTEAELKEHEKQCSKNLDKVEKSESIDKSTDTTIVPTQENQLKTSTYLIERGEGTSAGKNLLETIIRNASEYIDIEDNFINLAIIKRLLSNQKIKIRILTSLYNRHPNDIPDFVHIAKLLGQMEKSNDHRLQIRQTRGSWTHDRVLITETEGWALSTSLKDIMNDNKWSLMFRLPSEIINYIHDDFEGLWSAAIQVTAKSYSEIIRYQKRNM